jgi:hypothetical protein
MEERKKETKKEATDMESGVVVWHVSNTMKEREMESMQREAPSAVCSTFTSHSALYTLRVWKNVDR